ncbi:MAG: hypothetical protein MZV64_27940 [Ignavibacteriales bacterium]|nr:hypothetical protein [Ignavibacteriales bacterium]
MLVAILALYFLQRRATGGVHLRPARRSTSLRSACRHAGLALPGLRRWPSPSRCRCSRSTPGCPTPTSRRRRPAR